MNADGYKKQGGVFSRRSFLRGTACVALSGVGACTGLLPQGKLRKDAALSAILSDTHIGAWNSPKYQGEKFAECLARVLALDPLPARIFITGDFAYLWGRKEDYKLARELLQPVVDAGVEIVIGMGNHDRRENFLEFWPEYANRSPVEGRIVSKARGAHFDFIMLDTLDQPKETNRWITPGTLDDKQREWLAYECASSKRPLLVMGHHPADELGGGPNGVKGSHGFGRLLMVHKGSLTNCCGYIHGHNHQWYVTRSLLEWHNAAVGHTACLPSTGHWGDIGYALLREFPDRAELSLVQYDYFTPKPIEKGAKPNPAWQAIVRDNAGSRCTFVARKQ